MLHRLLFGLPVPLVVAPAAVDSETPAVGIHMTARASPCDICPNGPPVIVAAQTGRARVSAGKRVSGFFRVIKVKVFLQYVPAFGDVADRTILGKCFMRHQGPPILFVPGLQVGRFLLGENGVGQGPDDTGYNE